MTYVGSPTQGAFNAGRNSSEIMAVAQNHAGDIQQSPRPIGVGVDGLEG